MKPVLRLLGAVCILTVAGCANMPSPMPIAEVNQTSGYVLAAGDKLRITVYNEPGLTGEYTVSSAGNVALPLIGNVPAKQNSIDALSQAITAKLAGGYVKDPRVSVEVLNYRPYYILGEVNKPGEFPYSVNLTVEQAVAAAGGYTYRANTKSAIVRRAEDAAPHSVSINGRPVYVLPGDTIRIGERYF